MLVDYVLGALEHATYEILDSGRYFGSISECPGVWGEGENLEGRRREVQEVLEDWLILKLRDGDDIPVIDGHDLNLQQACQDSQAS